MANVYYNLAPSATDGLPYLDVVGSPASGVGVGLDQFSSSDYADPDVDYAPANRHKFFVWKVKWKTGSPTEQVALLARAANGGLTLWVDTSGNLNLRARNSGGGLVIATGTTAGLKPIADGNIYWVFFEFDERTVADGGTLGRFRVHADGSSTPTGTATNITNIATWDLTADHKTGYQSENFAGEMTQGHAAGDVEILEFREYDWSAGVIDADTIGPDIAQGIDDYTASMLRWYTGLVALPEDTLDPLVGEPEQYYLIHDALAAGASVVQTATSEFGPRTGPARPGTNNYGSLSALVLGDADGDTDAALTFQVVRSGGMGVAEWAYQGDEGSWFGYNSSSYMWGFHTPKGTGTNLNGIVVYSSLFSRVVVLTANGGAAGTVEIRYADRDARPQHNSEWTTASNFSPVRGVNEDDKQALAACELRDGTLLLAVRNYRPTQLSSFSASDVGDIDLYRSIDGGVTWSLACERVVERFGNNEVVLDDTMIRIAASGDWVRLCYGVPNRSIATLVSADAGGTWKRMATTITEAGHFAGTYNELDEMAYDIVGLDDNSGTFLMAYFDESSSVDPYFEYASREDDWTRADLLNSANEWESEKVRSLALVKTPTHIQLWMCMFSVRTDSSTNPAYDAWGLAEVPRGKVLDSSEWKRRNPPFQLNKTGRYRPIQITGEWCGDRAALLFYLEDVSETNVTSGHPIERPVLTWLGGFSERPFAYDQDSAEGTAEHVHWSYAYGSPTNVVGPAGSTFSSWSENLVATGTYSHTIQGVEITGPSANDAVTFELDLRDLINSGPGGTHGSTFDWDPPYAEEQQYKQKRLWVAEAVVACGATGSEGVNPHIHFSVALTSAQSTGDGWHLSVQMNPTSGRILLYDLVGNQPLLTLSGIALGTSLEENRYTRVRLACSPAMTSPSFVIMAREETGGPWQTAGPIELAYNAAWAASYDGQLIMGQGGGASTPAGMASRWREFRVANYWFRTDFAKDSGLTVPDDLAGMVTSVLPISLGAGSTASTPDALKAAWSGGTGVVGDTYSWELDHDHPAEHMFLDSPRYPYVSAAGATAGIVTEFVATGQDGTDTGGRWVHNAAAIFETGGAPWMKIEYATDSSFSSGLTEQTFDFTQFSGLRIEDASGRLVRWLHAGSGVNVREGELFGRYLRVTAEASSGRIGHVHRIARHWYDGTYHTVELDRDGQFDPDLIAAGDTVSILSNKAFALYPSTFVRRYMRVHFGQTGQNNWDGRWKLGRLVVGLARKFDPPLHWSFSDSERPDTTVVRTRGGVSWAYQEAPPERRIVGRWIGDYEGKRSAFRDAVKHLAAYQEQPIALTLDASHTLGQEDHLLLTRFDGGVDLDNQAWHIGADSFKRPVGDMQVFFKEIT